MLVDASVCHPVRLSVGFPVLISRVSYSNARLLHIGDAIVSINNENIAHLAHEQVMAKLREASGDHVDLTVKYMNNMAPYLHSTTSTARSSLSLVRAAAQTRYTLPTPSSVRVRRQQNRMSAEYPSGSHRTGKQQQRLSLMLSDQQKVRMASLSLRLPSNDRLDECRSFPVRAIHTEKNLLRS